MIEVGWRAVGEPAACHFILHCRVDKITVRSGYKSFLIIKITIERSNKQYCH